MNIHNAAENGNMNRVRTLLNQGTNVNTRNSQGDTPLIKAVYKGRTDVVRFLIKKGANVNARTEHNDTPIIIASYFGYTDIVRLLIQAGANVNARALYGIRAIRHATRQGHNDIVRLLMHAGATVKRYDYTLAKNNATRRVILRAASERQAIRTIRRVASGAVERFRRRKAESLLRSPRLLGNTKLTPNVIQRIASHLSAVRRN